jgi:hypothetical protein
MLNEFVRRRKNVKKSRRISAFILAAIACLLTTSLYAQYGESEAFVFQNSIGSQPNSLVEDSAGNFYGVAPYGGDSFCETSGCGTVFEVTNSGGTLNAIVIHEFTGGADGFIPVQIALDAAGNIYGVAYGGEQSNGKVFKMTPQAGGGWSYAVLYSFPNKVANGAHPVALVLDGKGNIYGETSWGGGYECGGGCGVVFELSPSSSSSWKETVLYRFTGRPDGALAYGRMILDSSGHLFGTTLSGGAHCGSGLGCGIVYELSPTASGSWTESVLHRFQFTDGAGPGSLIQDARGNIFGVTGDGGIQNGNCYSGCGTIFRLSPTPTGWSFSSVYQFTGSLSDGAYPNSVLANGGNLYAAASFPVQGAYGVIAKLSPKSSGWTESPLFVFSDASGGSDPTSLLMDASGNIFGSALYGGDVNGQLSGDGAVFELSPAASRR